MSLGADHVVQSLGRSLSSGGHSLSAVPGLLKRVIKEDLWRERTIERTGERIAFDRFDHFVTTPPLKGLGATLELIKNLVRSDPEATDLLDQALQRPAHAHARDVAADSNNITISRDPNARGTSTAGALRRLRKDAPELHARVIAGELSAHRAAVLAGHRRETFTVPADPERAARALRRRFTREELSALIAYLEPTEDARRTG